MDERLERMLDTMRDRAEQTAVGIARIEGGVATLGVKLDTVSKEASAANLAAATVRDSLAEHETEDAERFGATQAEVRRLWWGIGIVLAAILPVAINAILGIVKGAQ